MGLLSKLAAKEQVKSKPPPPREAGVVDEIEKWRTPGGSFLGTILEKKGGNDDFFLNVQTALFQIGAALQLNEDTCLMLLPKMQNMRLILHRLSQSFGANVLLSFESESADDALQYIKPYLNDRTD